jgi:hypothetical protein
MDLLDALIALDLALGALALVAAYWWMPGGFGRALVASAILALFFSVSIVVFRLALPVPTFALLIVLIMDLYQAMTTPCVMHSSEGCVPPGGDEAASYVLVPVLVQGAIWLVLASGLEAVLLRMRRRKDKR